MKNAVQYKNLWLMPGSKAKELYDNYRKDPKERKKLDDHLKEVNNTYVKLSGVSVSG